VALFTLKVMGLPQGLIVSFFRTVLGSLIGGGFLSVGFFLSFSGAMVSTLVMGLTMKWAPSGLSTPGVSVLGAVTHNVTQLMVASAIVRHTGLFFYLPYLLFFALPTGILVGVLASRLVAAVASYRGGAGRGG